MLSAVIQDYSCSHKPPQPRFWHSTILTGTNKNINQTMHVYLQTLSGLTFIINYLIVGDIAKLSILWCNLLHVCCTQCCCTAATALPCNVASAGTSVLQLVFHVKPSRMSNQHIKQQRIERIALRTWFIFDNVAGTTWTQSMQAGLQRQAFLNLSNIARVEEGEIDA